jgi:hypothetical protein
LPFWAKWHCCWGCRWQHGTTTTTKCWRRPFWLEFAIGRNFWNKLQSIVFAICGNISTLIRRNNVDLIRAKTVYKKAGMPDSNYPWISTLSIPWFYAAKGQLNGNNYYIYWRN